MAHGVSAAIGDPRRVYRFGFDFSSNETNNPIMINVRYYGIPTLLVLIIILLLMLNLITHSLDQLIPDGSLSPPYRLHYHWPCHK